MLTTEQFDAWLVALRSGQYQQGKGRLVSGSSYCCLGVLSKGLGRLSDGGCDTEGDNSMVGSDLLEPRLQEPLAKANDGGASFMEIADDLEKHRSLYTTPYTYIPEG